MTDYRRDVRLNGSVYRPAEDSHLLAEAALSVVPAGSVVIEVGVGSGVVAEYLAEERDVTVLGVDINPHACVAARDRGVPTVRASLLDPIRTAVADVVLFNPPYLPTDPSLPMDWLERAVAGGPTGAEVTAAWLDDLGRVLRDDGQAICIVSTVTGIDRVRDLATAAGFSSEELDVDHFPDERLVALHLRPIR